MTTPLTDSNFLIRAAKYYDNPSCLDMDEFNDDLSRFKYVKRLFTNYKESGVLKERLVLNHLIVLYNLFGDETTNMLFLKLEGQWQFLKPFLIAIDRLPEFVHHIGKHHTINCADIPCDMGIVSMLRKDLST